MTERETWRFSIGDTYLGTSTQGGVAGDKESVDGLQCQRDERDTGIQAMVVAGPPHPEGRLVVGSVLQGRPNQGRDLAVVVLTANSRS